MSETVQSALNKRQPEDQSARGTEKHAPDKDRENEFATVACDNGDATQTDQSAEGGSHWEIDGDALLGELGLLTAPAGVAEPESGNCPESMLAAMRRAGARVGELERENRELRTSLGRLREEYTNMNQRHARMRESDREQMLGELMKQVLPLMDNFERALEHATSGEIGEDFITGMVLLYKQLSDMLEQNRVVPIMARGAIFDPELHEAVVVEPSTEHETNLVIAEMEKGYTLGTRLLRPARVKVAVRPK